MQKPPSAFTTVDAARSVLGVSADATLEQVRAAYLEKVRQHPPDRDPDQFEKIRDAYDLLRDPRSRVLQVFEGPNPMDPLTSLLGDKPAARRFAGTGAWMAALKEKRS
jgi:curved DNA-binding protein CbpA